MQVLVKHKKQFSVFTLQELVQTAVPWPTCGAPESCSELHGLVLEVCCFGVGVGVSLFRLCL